MKKKLLLLLLLIFPLNVFAYSNKLIINGKQIGIEANSNGIYIVDLYKVNNKYPNLKKGDLINKINNIKVNSIKEFNEIVNKEGEYNLEIIRNNKTKNINLKTEKENNELKIGLYLKDKINGIGTLSYIDPETKIYASLGHEIIETNSMSLFNLKNGYIYDIDINYINKNKENEVGEFHGTFTSNLLGTINKNKINGIFGKYTNDINNNNLVEISNTPHQGKAYLRMNIDNTNKDYEINIINLDNTEKVKNIYFEIIDNELLNKTGGIIQGMSGTPIIQDEKIIGVVNYVIVDDNTKGYGIFIKTMLEEGDKLLN